MFNIFDTSSEKAGFRLQYMEIFNWGTFDGQVFRVTPNGNNSLLTGANGSGKTTFVDALLTLIVPAKKDRFYNQSSGVKKKGDRTEESYVCGHYGDIQKAGQMSTTTQLLRPKKKTRSVLLASFSNKDGKTVTLFQVRWFYNGEMKRAFGIAHEPLEIRKDFKEFDNNGNWKRRLSKKYNEGASKKRIEFLDGPTKYAKRIVMLFGMRSMRALSLFNQVVGIKVLGDLDEFIRKNMLEEKYPEAEFIQLKQSFVTLMDAKTNIDKAKEQIKQLKPIDAIAADLAEIETKLTELEETKELSVYWFAQKGVELARAELAKCKAELKGLNEELEDIKSNERELQDQATDLAVMIKSDAVGNQIKQLEKDIRQAERSKNHRTNKLNDYNRIATKIAFKQNPNETLFSENRELAKEKKKESEDIIEKANEGLRQLKNKKDFFEEKSQNLIDIIQTLQENKNNISGRVAEIREEILKHVKARREEIPFIGELIMIRESETQWEASIEKVLHNFALRLIVPEQYYKQVNEYVNKTNLKGRIIYQRFREEKSGLGIPRFKDGSQKRPRNNAKSSDNTLINKVLFKHNSPYAEWIENQISANYNYACVENLTAFNRFKERAMTKEGLIKFGGGKHEKDDRAHVSRRSNYVLGWDNKDKIRHLKRELRQYQLEEKDTAKALRELEKEIRGHQNLKDNFHTFFTNFLKYDEIDWRAYAKEIQEKEEQKSKLEKANDKVKELQRQLGIIQSNLKVLEQNKERKVKVISKKENEFDNIKLTQKEYTRVLKLIPEQPDIQIFERRNSHVLAVRFSTLKRTQEDFTRKLISSVSKLSNKKNKQEREVSSLIAAFKNPPAEIYEKFKDWRSDVNNLPEPHNLEFIAAYQKRYAELLDEDLPRFEKKFEDYLQETIINKVGDFRMFFVNWSDAIKDNIRLLNEALKEIDFNTGAEKTYIQLIARSKVSDEIKNFQKLLRSAIPNFKAMESSVNGRKRHFERHIAPLIEQLESENWRKKVMEVRSWFSYKAEEYYRETNETCKTYENMGQLSGGEKAQLTYTILGSAIAYQFGLTNENKRNNAFRFIAIDEAFKAQDEDKAQYLMKLCKQLHLQLLVVTPLDNIHIAEPYISFVHYVERKNDRNSWLYDMPINQFVEERERFELRVES